MPSLSLDSGEPFGLPKGTIRGLLTLAFSGATLYLWVSGGVVPEALLGVTTLIVGNYFGTRGGAPDAPAAEEDEILAEPFVGEEPEA